MELDRDTLLRLYRGMVLVRTFEERFSRENQAGKPIGGGHSSAGQEAVSVGVCAALREDDYVASTHRGHGHCIAKGVDVRGMMAELYGRTTGTCKGGSMHIADFSKGMLGANGVVGGNMPLATGAALSARMRGTDQVSVCFFGDGASNQGTFHESANLASIWKLPVLFVCENNLYAESTPADYSLSVRDVADRAAGYSMPGVIVDGQGIFAVYEVARAAVARGRAGQGPTLTEAKTYRYGGHFLADDPHRYRSVEEEEHYKARDCIKQFREHVLAAELLRTSDLEAIDGECLAQLDEAVTFAEASPQPELSELLTDVYVKYP